MFEAILRAFGENKSVELEFMLRIKTEKKNDWRKMSDGNLVIGDKILSKISASRKL